MEKNTKLNWFNTFAILAVSFVWLFETSAIGPALGTIAAAFPEQHHWK